jgi:hypothetical protein
VIILSNWLIYLFPVIITLRQQQKTFCFATKKTIVVLSSVSDADFRIQQGCQILDIPLDSIHFLYGQFHVTHVTFQFLKAHKMLTKAHRKLKIWQLHISQTTPTTQNFMLVSRIVSEI